MSATRLASLFSARKSADDSRTGLSLSTRFVAIIIVLELGFGVLLGVTVSLYSLRAAAEDRRASLAYVTGVVAASLMPVVADQDPARIEAQLESIVGLPEGYEIECIRITDTRGHVLAESSPQCTCDDVETVGGGLFSLYTEAQVVEQPIVVGDLPVAVASVQFRPIGLEESFWQPLRGTGMIVVGVVLLSTLWGTWLILRAVVEPIDSLKDGAERIAQGDRKLDLWSERGDEIGQLARSLDEMMRQLEEKEDNLLGSYHSLEEALRAQERLGLELQKNIQVRSDFVAVASHELRSPLAIIQLYGEMMASGEFGKLDEQTQSAVASIVSAATRLGSIMTNLMDVALLERGVMPLEFAPTRFDAIIISATHDADALGASRGVGAALASSPPSVTMRGDRVRLRQIMDNLLSNAVKYSPEGTTVQVSVETAGGRVTVRVRDHGRGIPDDRKHVLFEPFGRVESGDAATSAGLGLGLAISSRIAEAHGGALTAEEPDEGDGTVFVLDMPLEPEAEMPTLQVIPD